MDIKNFRTIGLILLFFFIVPNNTEESIQSIQDERHAADADNLLHATAFIYYKWIELCVLGNQDLEPETVAELFQALPGDKCSAFLDYEKLSENQKLWADLGLIKNESDPELIQRVFKDNLEKLEDSYEGKEKKLTQLKDWDNIHQESERIKRWKELDTWGKRDFYPEMDNREKVELARETRHKIPNTGKQIPDAESQQTWRQRRRLDKQERQPILKKGFKRNSVENLSWGGVHPLVRKFGTDHIVVSQQQAPVY